MQQIGYIRHAPLTACPGPANRFHTPPPWCLFRDGWWTSFARAANGGKVWSFTPDTVAARVQDALSSSTREAVQDAYRTEVRCCIPLFFQGVFTGSYTRYVFPPRPALHGFESDSVPREIVVQVCAFEVPPRCWSSLLVACRCRITQQVHNLWMPSRQRRIVLCFGLVRL